MFDFLAEYLLLAFTLGGILGATVASHLVVRHRRPVVVTRCGQQNAQAGDLAPARLPKDRAR